jgi:hypothetical protein
MINRLRTTTTFLGTTAFVLAVAFLLSPFPAVQAASTSTATCSETVAVQVGDSVNWQANIDNGSGTITYNWSGTESLSGTSDTVFHTYSSAGNVTASVQVSRTTSGDSSVSCTISSTITPNPNPVVAPTVNLTIGGQSSLTVTEGATSTIDWQTTNTPDSCTAFGTWSGAKNVSGGSEALTFSILGQQDFGLSCQNAAGQATSTVSVTVNPQATTTPTNTKPVITLLGNQTIHVTQGDTFTDPGATASDTEDGDITANIVVTGTVDTGAISTTTLTYNVSDSQGLAADPVTRTVIVETAPVTPPGGPTTATSSCTLSVSVISGQTVEWKANVSGQPTPLDIQWTGTENLSGTSTTTTKTYTSGGTKIGTVTVSATGSNPTISGCSITATIVNQCLAPEFTSLLSVGATTGTFFAYTLTATSTDSFTLDDSALPTGLSYSTTTHQISGTPLQTGTFSIPLTATNSCNTISDTLTITVTSGGGGGSSTGSITICKLLLDEAGNIATSTAGLPSGAFSINLATDKNIASSTIRTASFAVNSFNKNTVLFGGSADSQCTTFTNLPEATYYYGEESITPSASWLTPKYNDQFVIGTSTSTEFYNYDSTDINATTTNTVSWNDQFDGVIVLSPSLGLNRTLVVKNQPTIVPPLCEIPAFTSSLALTVLVNQSFSYTLSATTTTATSSISYDLATSTLPAGLSYSTTTNQITGTPTSAGTYSISLSAINSCGTASETLVLTVNNPGGGGGGGSRQCSDSLDNDGDGKIDGADPACHTDGDPTNPTSYDPNIDNENSKPVITLIGQNTILITKGQNFTDEGATAHDDEDGDITANIVVSGNVNTSSNGQYTLTYNVSDSKGLAADPVTRTINVSGGGGGGGGGGVPQSNLQITNEQVSEVETNVALVEWNTNLPATRQVFYGTKSLSDTELSNIALNYGYDAQTLAINTPELTQHTVAVFGLNLQAGITYYFRPVSTHNNMTAIGRELSFTPGPSAPQSCSFLIDYLKIGENNNPVEVRKLQLFLRTFEGFDSVQVTGTFDQVTFDAVEIFQQRYGADVLNPWGYRVDEPTGYVYITTKKKINEIYCQHAFPVTVQQQSEIDAFNAFLQSLEQAGVPVSGGTVTPPTHIGPSGVIDTGIIGLGDIQNNATSTTATSTGFFANLAAGALALPSTLNEAGTALALLILTLILIYIFGTIVAYAISGEGRSNSKIMRTRKLMLFSIGVLAALIFSSFMPAMYILVLPLLILFVLLIAITAWYSNWTGTQDAPVIDIRLSAAKPIFVAPLADADKPKEEEQIPEPITTSPTEVK